MLRTMQPRRLHRPLGDLGLLQAALLPFSTHRVQTLFYPGTRKATWVYIICIIANSRYALAEHVEGWISLLMSCTAGLGHVRVSPCIWMCGVSAFLVLGPHMVMFVVTAAGLLHCFVRACSASVVYVS